MTATNMGALDTVGRSSTNATLRGAVLTLSILLAAGVSAQEDENEEKERIEEVTVTGYRQTIRNSIETKRLSNNLVEALSADDIGDIPALSIGEALETLTSAASHRDQGGATEISIRGMGPFLGSTTINGREATNGSGDRSVNFSQFPSELFQKIKIYKTQEASLIEGGVSGQIALDTLKPLEYKKRRFQANIKGAYNPNNQDIDSSLRERDLGSRTTLSYIDQFDFANGQSFGFSVGYQRNLTTNPEQEARTTSTWRDCRRDPLVEGGIFRDSSGNCDSGSGNLDLEVDPETGVAPDGNAAFVFVPSSRSFRQNVTDDDRESIFAAVQWRPNDRIDINFDLQSSNRTFSEVRNDLVFSEQRRIIPGLTDESLVADSFGSVSFFETIGRIETNSQFQERLEKYDGGGLEFDFQLTDTLNVSVDASYSYTDRQENIFQTRLQSEPTDIFGNPTPAGSDRVRTTASVDGNLTYFTVDNFDVNNPDLFADSARTRIDLNQKRENQIVALRSDFLWDTNDLGFVTSLEGGVRYSELTFEASPRVRDEFTFEDSAIAGASLACRNESFPESGFLSEEANGPLITNLDDAGNVINAGNTYATFDALCLVREFLGEVPPVPGVQPSVENVDVSEDTIAAYLQANYEGELSGLPIRGNFGLRVVNSDVSSTGLRTTFTTTTDADGVITVVENPDDFTAVNGGGSYTELLPSVNLVVDVADDVIMRGAVYRGLSRPDPADLGFGRRLQVDDNDDPTSLAELDGFATASGNPDLEPLTSWNFDVALEWYPNEDTILAGAFYYKRFTGGFENTVQIEQFDIDGQPFFANVATTQTDNNESTLFGFEFTAAHRFSYLPGYLSGLGAKLSLNFADSDFEFEDGAFGSAVVADESGAVVSEQTGIIPPANLFGFSDTVASAQLYYDIGAFDFAIIYKHRSEYFQQFVTTPTVIRFIDSNNVYEARATYKINKFLTLRAEGINLFDEPRVHFNPTGSNLAETNSYGPRYFLGIRAKL